MARAIGRLEHLPQRPSPEVDIGVVQTGDMTEHCPAAGQTDEISQEPVKSSLRVIGTFAGIESLPAVGRITHADQHARLFLHFPCSPVFVYQRTKRQREAARRSYIR